MHFPSFLRANSGVPAVTAAAPSTAKPSPKDVPRPRAPLTLQDAGWHGVQPLAQGGSPRQLQQRQQRQQHGGDQEQPEESAQCPLAFSLHPRAGKGGQEGGAPEVSEAGEEGWIYTVPPGRWEEREAGGGGGLGCVIGEHKQASSLMSRQDASSGRGARGGAERGGAQPRLQCRLCSTGPPGGQHQTGAALQRCPLPLIIFTPSLP